MKLYTEEQIRIILNRIICDKEAVDEYIDRMIPIELPSDEEIIEVAIVVYGFNAKDIKDVLEYKAFQRGAKWMRDKILNK